jgi:toxin HigB-1
LLKIIFLSSEYLYKIVLFYKILYSLTISSLTSVTLRVTVVVSTEPTESFMIISFKHKGLEKFFKTGTLKGIQNKHKVKLALILDLLHRIESVDDLSFMPGLNLHKLLPKQNNIWAVRVSGNWRITFKFENKNVYIVDYLDYH